MGFEEANPPKNDGDGGGNSKWGGKAASGSAGDQKRYMQGYLQVIYNIYGKWNFSKQQQALANKAFGIRMSPSMFALLIRRSDPAYVGSREYKTRVAQAQDIYQQFRGYGRVMPREFGHAFATSDMNAARLVDKIQQTAWFKRQYPAWKQAVNNGTIANSGAGARAYVSMRSMLNNSFRNYAGQEASPLLHKMMFSAGMGEEEVAKNLVGLFGGQEAMRFATGSTMEADDILRAALTKRFGMAGINKVGRAQSIAGSFQNSQLSPFDVNMNKSGQIVMQGI